MSRVVRPLPMPETLTPSEQTWEELIGHAVELSDLIAELEAMSADATNEVEVG